MKMKSTYVDGILEKVTDGKIHPQFHILGTDTFRLACSGPSLQNIPKADKDGFHKLKKASYADKIRFGFIPPEGYVFISSDYKQLEYRFISLESGDQKLIKAFQNEWDIHSAVAAENFNKNIEEVSTEERHIGKTINFGIAYLQKAPSLSKGGLKYAFSKDKPCTVKQAQAVIDKTHRDFPQMKAMFDKLEEQILTQQFTESRYGTRRRVPILTNNRKMTGDAIRALSNAFIQSSSSLMAMYAAVRMHQEFNSKECFPSILIHDDVTCCCLKEKVDYYLPKIKELMEKPPFESEVPFTVDSKVQERWAMIGEED